MNEIQMQRGSNEHLFDRDAQYAHFWGKFPLSSHKTTLKQLKVMKNKREKLTLFLLSFCRLFSA